jgi:hypothetical protein
MMLRRNPKSWMISSASRANRSSLADPIEPATHDLVVVEAMTVTAADVNVPKLLGEPHAGGRQHGPNIVIPPRAAGQAHLVARGLNDLKSERRVVLDEFSSVGWRAIHSAGYHVNNLLSTRPGCSSNGRGATSTSFAQPMV